MGSPEPLLVGLRRGVAERAPPLEIPAKLLELIRLERASRTRSSTRPHAASRRPRDVGARAIESATRPAHGAARHGAGGTAGTRTDPTPAPGTGRLARDHPDGSRWGAGPGSSARSCCPWDCGRSAAACLHPEGSCSRGSARPCRAPRRARRHPGRPARRRAPSTARRHERARRADAGGCPARRSRDRSSCSGGGTGSRPHGRTGQAVAKRRFTSMAKKSRTICPQTSPE